MTLAEQIMPTLYVATIDAWAPSTSLDSQNARVHWTVRRKRYYMVTGLVYAALYQAGVPRGMFERRASGHAGKPREWSVTFEVRKVGRTPDSDNCVASLKHARDSVARYLGCDDGPAGPTWVYEPWTRGKARVVITIGREGMCPS